MTIQIQPYTPEHEPEVAAFNARLRSQGIRMRFPELSIPHWLPHVPGRTLFQDYYVAVDGDKIRGGYILKHQQFIVKGSELSIGNFQLPISEGIIDKSFTGVGLLLLADAQRRQPLLYSLGIGSQQEPLARLLRSMHWSFGTVPFYFKAVHPFRFLREIQFLRSRKLRARILDLLAFSGVGWIALKTAQAAKSRTKNNSHLQSREKVSGFGPWADQLWQEVVGEYELSAVRDSSILNILYPSHDSRFITLKVETAGRLVGWAVVLATQLESHRHFGKMRLGSIVDCLSLPGEEGVVISVAEGVLREQGTDLIVSNQANEKWCRALSRSGFLAGPSNFFFFCSKSLSQRIQPLEQSLIKMHLNRGDGDGPINL